MEDSDSHSSFSLSRFLCQKTGTSMDGEEVDEYTLDNEAEDEYVQLLLHREVALFGLKKIESLSILGASWIECARLDAIQWILNTRASFGFRYQTAYLSVTYLDRFLSKRVVHNEKHWAIKLLSVACFSLAAKLEECRVPMLSEFHVGDYNFESKVIQRMELLVLNTLEWEMGSVTPFGYVHYYFTRFCKDSTPKSDVNRTMDLLMVTLRDADLLSYRPSIVAGAATLVVLDQKLTREAMEFKINNALLPNGFLEIEDVFACYNRMRELDFIKLRSPLSPVIQLRKMNPFESNSVTTNVSTKRKRLTFNDDDQDIDIADWKQTSQRKSD